MTHAPVPSPTPIFVGRAAELGRCERALESVCVALICGVGGIGKSALAYSVASRWRGETIYSKLGDEPLSSVVGAAFRLLGDERVADHGDVEERILHLAGRLGERDVLWVIDDLHRLSNDERRRLLTTLSRSLRAGRVVATSRERIERGPGDPDWLELRLDGLDEGAARSLWQSLDELYGPAAGFEPAWGKSRGSPFELRRLHAGGLDDERPLVEAIAALPDDELFLAGALAVSRIRLPVAVLTSLLPAAERAQRALRRLVTLLIADVDGRGTAGMHDLIRDAVGEALSPAVGTAVRTALVEALPAASLELFEAGRETLGHLLALERYPDACTFLVEHAQQLAGRGHTADVLRWIDAIPNAERTPELRLVRARCMAHAHDVRSAYEEVAQVAREHSSHEISLVLGEIATIRGEMAVGAEALASLIEDDSAAAALRVQAQVTYAFNIAMQGRGDEARGILRAAERAADDPVRAAHLAFAQARTLWLEERDREAEEPMRRAAPLLADSGPLPYEASVLVPTGSAAILSRLGRFDEVDERMAAAHRVGERQLDASSALYFRRMCAGIAYERGERLAALASLRAALVEWQRAGSLNAMLVLPWVGRILLVLGRRKEAERVLAEAHEQAVARGLGVSVAAVEQSRRLDPLAQLRAGPTPIVAESKRGECARAHAVAAVRAAALGDEAEARARVAAAEPCATGPGYALDRAMCVLALAVLARRAGDAVRAAELVARAAREAAEDDADPGIVEAMLAVVDALPSGAGDLVLDGRAHVLRYGGDALELGRRPVVRRLLYALAACPNEVVGKEQIVRAVWAAEYDPIRHDNQLWVNVRRLRVLLEPTGLEVVSDEGGYCLRAPRQLVFVAPAR